MKTEKQTCKRCDGIGCVDCAWSGKIYKNTEFDDVNSGGNGE